MRSFGKIDRWPILRLRWGRILTLLVLLPLLLAYVGSYYYLSRRGIREAEKVHFNGFLYIPMEDLDIHDLSLHYKLARFYAPLNWIDRTFFSGKGLVL